MLVDDCVVIAGTWPLSHPPLPPCYPQKNSVLFSYPQVKAEEVCVQLTNEYEERLASVSPSQFTLRVSVVCFGLCSPRLFIWFIWKQPRNKVCWYEMFLPSHKSFWSSQETSQSVLMWPGLGDILLTDVTHHQLFFFMLNSLSAADESW